MIDFLIVGYGQSSYLLAIKLLSRGYKVNIVGNSKAGEASRISSGLINPVTGRRFVKTWKYDELISILIPFYKELEERYNTQFLFEYSLLLQLESIEQENDWNLRLTDPEYNKFCSIYSPRLIKEFLLDDSKSYGLIDPVYRVAVSELMSCIELELQKQHCLLNEEFIYNELIVEKEELIYRNLKAKFIVFCEGVFVQNNPYFSYLPIFKLKGERTLFSGAMSSNKILSAKYSIVPQNDKYWIGSNYSLDDLTEEITEVEGLNQSNFAYQYLTPESKRLNQEFGFRPSSRDRRPIIGSHPNFHNIYLLNGLGTKASSLLPYCINLLERHFTQSEDIPAELSPKRFVKKGYKFN
ncbi:MAG: FAD-binding oxidoreductase [Saprospiraceae bacterium]|nr:FAD-binding oxidoreductase [Saprospiraceae bacterium]